VCTDQNGGVGLKAKSKGCSEKRVMNKTQLGVLNELTSTCPLGDATEQGTKEFLARREAGSGEKKNCYGGSCNAGRGRKALVLGVEELVGLCEALLKYHRAGSCKITLEKKHGNTGRGNIW